MHAQTEATLQRLLESDADLARDPTRLGPLLERELGAGSPEVAALLAAVYAGATRAMVYSPGAPDVTLWASVLVRGHGLTDPEAMWAVTTWSRALAAARKQAITPPTGLGPSLAPAVPAPQQPPLELPGPTGSARGAVPAVVWLGWALGALLVLACLAFVLWPQKPGADRDAARAVRADSLAPAAPADSLVPAPAVAPVANAGRKDYLRDGCPEMYLRPDGSESVGSEFRLTSWKLPAEVSPGQEIESTIDWQTTRGNPNAVVYATVMGDWDPDEPIAQLWQGMQGLPGTEVQRSFSFHAPQQPGTYRARWVLAQAFKPITCFYGKEHQGAEDPGYGTWSEATFVVSPSVATTVPTGSGVETPASGADASAPAVGATDAPELAAGGEPQDGQHHDHSERHERWIDPAEEWTPDKGFELGFGLGDPKQGTVTVYVDDIRALRVEPEGAGPGRTVILDWPGKVDPITHMLLIRAGRDLRLRYVFERDGHEQTSYDRYFPNQGSDFEMIHRE